MNDLADILTPESVALGLDVPNKKALFREIVARAAKVTGCPAESIEAPIKARERLASTGYGRGVAIPHAQLDCVGEVHGLFFRLARPIDYGAVDGMPVDCVFTLLSPSDTGAGHLKALARVSRSFRDERFVAKLRGARSQDALYALFAQLPAADAA
ncbi:MAG: PTS sugar transporter subunit IIA [Sphingomonadaceae bacterium]|nr:PTS sugar transporter subunit IIA [Sphingomonadaceae bacterium]